LIAKLVYVFLIRGIFQCDLTTAYQIYYIKLINVEEHVVFQTNYLGLIGGKDVADTTKRIASTLLSNHLATQLNYEGRGSKSKRGVKGLRLTLLVIGL